MSNAITGRDFVMMMSTGINMPPWSGGC
jgi:hypothetical protein